MAEGKAISIVAVNGGYIVEYNELVRMPMDTSFKTEKNEKIKVIQHRVGGHKVAVRATVEEVMKFVAELLVLRMQAGQQDDEAMELVTGKHIYSPDSNLDVEAKQVSPMPSAPGGYAVNA